MRVLWLCSTPSLGAELMGASAAQVGGWVGALERVVRDLAAPGELELTVAFPWSVGEPRQVGQVDSSNYLPFPRYPRGGRWRQLLVDVSCRIEPEGEVEHLEQVVALSQPDLIHVWGSEAHFGLIADRCQIPVLVEIQGLMTACSHLYFSGLTRADLLRHGSPGRLLKGRSLLHRYYRYRRQAVRERHILERARFVSGRTAWDRAACQVLAPGARYSHCDRVLRPEFYLPTWERNDSDRPLRIVSTLRGNAYKGIETVASAAQRLQGLLTSGFEWTLIGIRNGEEIQRIVERKLGVAFEQLGLRTPGRRDATEVARELAESDLYVQPSRIENSPNGLCEAMLVGLPIVTTSAGGVPSLLEAEREGLMIPPGDPWAMAGAIRRLAEDGELAESLAARARARARARHEPTAIARRTLEIYHSILSEGSSSAG